MRHLINRICCIAGRVTALEQKPDPVLTVARAPLYEYRDLWAEEGGGTDANSAEYSYGNGSTGFIGLPIDGDEGWELVELRLNADTFAANAVLQVDAMAYPSNGPGSSTANTLASILVNGATDGGGEVNNARKVVVLPTPVPVPTCALGFITRTRTGNSSDVRVFARLRRQTGTYISDVTLE